MAKKLIKSIVRTRGISENQKEETGQPEIMRSEMNSSWYEITLDPEAKKQDVSEEHIVVLHSHHYSTGMNYLEPENDN